jgi:hypothetical protein
MICPIGMSIFIWVKYGFKKMVDCNKFVIKEIYKDLYTFFNPAKD